MDSYNKCGYCDEIIDDYRDGWVTIDEDYYHTQCLIEENKDRSIAQLIDTLGITDSNESGVTC